MHYDVAVVGGGIIGASSAYALSKEGLKVILLDARQFGSGASGRSAAMLEFQIDAHRGEPFVSLARASTQMFAPLYKEIKEKTGIDFHLQWCGILQVAFSNEEADFLKKEAERQAKLGLNAQWWPKEVIQAKFPSMDASQMGGTFFAEDGQVNGDDYLNGMLEAGRKNGVDLSENNKSIRFLIDNGRVAGVETEKQKITARHVVLSAGAWTDQILEPLGVKLGIEPVRGQLLVYESGDQTALGFPIYTKRNGYIVPKPNGTILIGTTVERAGFEERVTEEGKSSMLKLGTALTPETTRKSLKTVTAGLRPGSPDELPLLGPLRNHANVIIASGHYRNGILLAPITAQAVSNFVLKKPQPLDLSPFSPNRFLI